MWKKYILILCVFMVGCASGNRYNYRSQTVILPLKTSVQNALVLAVEDLRPYVLNGKKKADFVGVQRGGYGNPFDVTTASGESLTDDMATSIGNGLESAGYRVIAAVGKPELAQFVHTAQKNNASRIVWLKVRDWKSDIFMSVRLKFDLSLVVYDAIGNLLAENTMKGDEPVGGGKLGASKNSQHMGEEFSKRIGYLFNKKSIRDALEPIQNH